MRALPPLLLALSAAPSGAFAPSCRASAARPRAPLPIRRVATRDPDASAQTFEWDDEPLSSDSEDPSPEGILRLEARASSGIDCRSDLPRILDAASSVCEEYGLPLDSDGVRCDESPCRCPAIPGVLGRVLLLHVQGLPSGDFDIDEDEFLMQLKVDLSERIDAVLMRGGEESMGGGQPVLVAIRPEGDDGAMPDVIEKEVSDYGLRDAVDDVCSTEDELCFVHPMAFEINCYPSSVIEIDGAMIDTVDEPGRTHFDTSSVLVFDKLLDEKLRKRLLNVVKGYPEDHTAAEDDWDDAENGPDPERWVRGGLVDVAGGGSDADGGGSCWGLTDDAIMDMCHGDHPAIAEFESRLVRLFPDFVVSRLPEAVLGGCVSPLTANAPTSGDRFDYHIDADPLQVPPSPWADVFGRYPNRSRGRPRFVSCLAYLNDEWDAAAWGAPTRFLDPPTGETIDVDPRPGRCVVMDQDVSHTVVAPRREAGARPRYSLVWKLVLHPTEGRGVDLACGRGGMWPEATAVGSATEASHSRDES